VDVLLSRAVVIDRHGGPEVMRVVERPVLSPEATQVLVRVTAAGVNFIDTYFRSGLYPGALPMTLGLEGAGTIEAVGPRVDAFSVGDRVAWTPVPGSYAEHVVAEQNTLVKIPDAVSDEVAAASMLQGMTAHYLVHGCRRTGPGDVALVHAAAGGAGRLTVQMLVHAGARVIGTCSTAAKAVVAREAGCDEVILYTESDFVAEAQRLTGGRGVDVVYDGVGKTTFERGFECLAPRGLMVLYGYASGKPELFDVDRLQGFGSVFLTRPSLFHYTLTREEYLERAGAVFEAVAQGWLRIEIGARFGLDDAGRAHAALQGRRTTGKVLLLP
jgi:NADPH2:quinone reductase